MGCSSASRSTVITYEQYSPLQSIFSVGWAVIGGLGFVIGAVFSAPNAIGGLGTRIFDDVLGVGEWDVLVGGLILLVIIVVHQDGIAEYVTHALDRSSADCASSRVTATRLPCKCSRPSRFPPPR